MPWCVRTSGLPKRPPKNSRRQCLNCLFYTSHDGGKPLELDAAGMTVRTEAGMIKADVINIIPPMRAANIALEMDLADKTGFCPVDSRNFES